MYEEFYGLAEEPFNTTPDPRFLYLGESHEEGLAHLLYGVERKKGLIVLTGEIGTGKTTLLNSLVQRLDERTHIAFLVDSQVSLLDIFQCLFSEFGLALRGQTKGEFLIELKRFLLSCSKAEEKVVLIVDEAQNLSLDVLEGLRLLTNFETPKEKLLQILLVGQPGLDDKLRSPELAQLKQRIGISYCLLPLSSHETKGYIDKRLTVAGATYPIFTAEAIDEIYKYSRGIPRVINIMGDLALFFGSADQEREIGRSTILQVAESLNYKGEKQAEQRREREGDAEKHSIAPTGGESQNGLDKADAIVIKHAKGFLLQDFPELADSSEHSTPSRGRAAQQRRAAQRGFWRPVRLSIAVIILLGLIGGGVWAQRNGRLGDTIEKFSQTVWQYYKEKFSSADMTLPWANTTNQTKQPVEASTPKPPKPPEQTVVEEAKTTTMLPLLNTMGEIKRSRETPLLPTPELQAFAVSPRPEQRAIPSPSTLSSPVTSKEAPTPQTSLTTRLDPAAPQTQLSGSKVIIVQPSESLTGIILREYGQFNERLLSLVQKANPHITDTSHIQVGQRIVLPALTE